MQATGVQHIWEANKSLILIAILVIFHTVGVIGLSLPAFREQFLDLSFFNLALSAVVLWLSRKKATLAYAGFLAVCFFVGMTAEWIGIHTGYLFGDYKYGSNLGWKWMDVPVIIGVNWGLLTIASASLVVGLTAPHWVKALLSAAAMTLLDFLIEPVAIASDYWTWNSPDIPLFNYLCWFLISLPLHIAYFRFGLAERSTVGIALYLILSVFFLILNR